MRVLPRLGVVTMATGVCLASVLVGSASAQAPTKSGWWNAATANGVALPAPTTSADDLQISQGANGPAAFAAVAYDLPGLTVSSAVLQFKVVANSKVGTIAALACPTKDVAWKAGGNQPYDAKPDYDCTRGVHALVSADGTTLSFLLDSAQQLGSGGFSLALVPATDASPFSVDLSKPDDSTLTAQVVAAPVAAAPAVPAAAPAPPVATGGSGSTGTSSFGGLSAVAVPQVQQPAAPAPQAAPPAEQPSLTAAAPVRAAAQTDVAPSGNRERYLAGSLLALMAGALVWAMQQPVPTPRRIGGLARTAAPTEAALTAQSVGPVRGIGRFAVARTAPARRLV